MGAVLSDGLLQSVVNHCGCSATWSSCATHADAPGRKGRLLLTRGRRWLRTLCDYLKNAGSNETSPGAQALWTSYPCAMKLCILSYTTELGGAEIHTISLARALASRGHEIVIYQLGNDIYSNVEFDSNTKIRIARLETPPPPTSMNFTDWFLILWNLEGSVCLMPKGTWDRGSWQLDLAARLCFGRFITIEHLVCSPIPPKSSRRHLGGLLPGMGLWWFRAWLSRYVRSLGPHRVFCVAEVVRQRLAQECAFPLRKLITVHNGIDPRIFYQSPESRRKMRNAWGVSDEALVFGFVGRFNVQKAIHLAIDAFQQLLSAFPGIDMHLVLIGEGPLREDLVRIAQDFGLRGRFHLLGYTDRPAEAYSALDIFVLPSLHEGLPFALLEAMACGCCPIATRVGGVPEVLTDGGLGWLVEPNDVPGLLAAMEAAVRTPIETRVEMVQRARELVLARFNAQIQYGMLVDLIEQEYDNHTGRCWGKRSRICADANTQHKSVLPDQTSFH